MAGTATPIHTQATDDSSGILADLAAAYLSRLAATQTLETGFDDATASALGELVAQSTQFLANLCFEAKERAQCGRRSTVTSLDVLGACEAAGMDAATLTEFNGRKREELAEVNTTYEATDYLDLPTDAPLILPTDKDEANVELFSRLPIQPDHLPFLPPPHLYKTTPVYEEKENSTEVRVRETRLVEGSLRNLIRATTSASATASSSRAQQQQQQQLSSSITNENAGPGNSHLSEDLVHLELLARSNTDEVMDASIVNWKAGRALQSLGPALREARNRSGVLGTKRAAEVKGGGRMKKIRWSVA